MCYLDDFKYMSWLHIAKRKSEMVKLVSNLLGILKDKGIKVEYLRCNNADENMSKLRNFFQKEDI